MEARRGGDSSWNGQRGSRSQPRHEYREAYRGRERYSPAGGYEAPQAPKRMRQDWWDSILTIIPSILIRNIVFNSFREDRRYGFEAGYASNMGPWGPSESAVNLPANNSSYGGSSTSRYSSLILNWNWIDFVNFFGVTTGPKSFLLNRRWCRSRPFWPPTTIPYRTKRPSKSTPNINWNSGASSSTNSSPATKTKNGIGVFLFWGAISFVSIQILFPVTVLDSSF